MRLARPFVRLPLQFDAERLREEVLNLPPEAWAAHPNKIPGNSSVRLISAGGSENDDVEGMMQATPHLTRMPYVQQVLASFGVVWGRSRLMRLAPGADVPEHADINYHWFRRVRLHVPIITRPEVRFRCENESVHMKAGEAWVFDNWRLHSVVNPTEFERIHLVADTTGSASFWQFVQQSAAGTNQDIVHRFDPAKQVRLLTETSTTSPVLLPTEVDVQVADIIGELVLLADTPEARDRRAKYQAMLVAFSQDWRQLYLLYGEHEQGFAEYARVRESVRTASRALSEGLVMRTNRVAAHTVFEARILQHLLSHRLEERRHKRATSVRRIERPVFIVAAPRSGSTLLFETLTSSTSVMSVGGEAHLMIEGIPELRVGAPNVQSNRLTAEHLQPSYADRIENFILERLQDAQGQRLSAPTLRFVEKTPKNALRIPLLDAVFKDALFIFLWRDPRENISSIMEAWRSGNWKTYNGLKGFDGPWSLLLPPGWEQMNGQPLEEIAAFQWEATNRIVLEDLSKLPRSRWTSISYGELTQQPQVSIARVCDFASIEIDEVLRTRLAQSLPMSRYTHTPPAPDKWRVNEAAVQRVLGSVEATWQQLRSLRPG
ncbi:MAG TPA: sulfotransferase [Steroidobacteraceae bacterium]|nr:sulfotransferase [Steroidobacteraceae bacterium]